VDAILKITDASGKSWEVNLLPGAIYNIGRAKDNDIVLNDRRVSRRHAHVVAENGEIKIVDGFEAGGEVRRSVNRVFVNNVPRLEKILEPNDQIIIGESKLIFEKINSVKAPAPPSAEKTRATILPSGGATEAVSGGVKYDDQPLGYTQMQISAGEIIGQRSNLSLETKIATPDELKDLRRKAKALDLLYEMSKTLGTVFDLKEIFAARRI
jgi:pSer/pThr/pTyr-binding forkhead associated (FHA) protein